ncbi:MAG TPA: DUF4097 family beta strand repeat-containing protein [Pseudonocardia sp.]|nr:DUF4097 family beta strand repeat-containing protein [Pseudonocardia sp.]
MDPTEPVQRPARGPSPRRPRSGRRRRIALGVAVVAGGLLLLGLLLRGEDVTTATIGGVREVVVDVDAGSAVLVAGPGPGVTVRAARSWIVGEPITRHDVDDAGVLHVQARCPNAAIACHVTEELTVPPGIPVQVTASAGGITARGLEVPSLTLRSSAGRVDADDLSVGRLDARSSAGGVNASFTDPPDEVRAESSAGSVALTVPDGSYRVDAGTSAGSVRVEVVQDPASPRFLYAHSSAGDVTIDRG